MIRRDVSRIFTGAWEASAISLPIPSGTSIQHNFTPPLKKHLAPSLGISRTATITAFWNGSEQTCTNLENNTPLLSSCRMRQENQRNPTTTGAISKTVFPRWAEFRSLISRFVVLTFLLSQQQEAKAHVQKTEDIVQTRCQCGVWV